MRPTSYLGDDYKEKESVAHSAIYVSVPQVIYYTGISNDLISTRIGVDGKDRTELCPAAQRMICWKYNIGVRLVMI